jgi:hypothetical protein
MKGLVLVGALDGVVLILLGMVLRLFIPPLRRSRKFFAFEMSGEVS